MWRKYQRMDCLVATLDLQTTSEISRIGGMTCDENGTMFITEPTLNHIYKVSFPSNIVELISGSRKGYQDGTLQEAQFAYPRGICCDKKGNLFVADSDNAAIRKIDLISKTVCTIFDGVRGVHLALDSNSLYVTQTLSITRLIFPKTETGSIEHQKIPIQARTSMTSTYCFGSGISVDLDGSLLVCDSLAGCIWRVRMENEQERPKYGYHGVTIVDGEFCRATFNYPNDNCLDNDGNLLVCDTMNFAIRKLNFRTGRVSTVAGNGKEDITDGLSCNASFSIPSCITCFGSTIYVADQGCIRKISRAWDTVRLLWIGKLKHSKSECGLAVLPHDIIKEIIYTWICGTVKIPVKRKIEPVEPFKLKKRPKKEFKF